MEKLTDEQLDALEQYYRRTLQDYIDKPYTQEIRALIAEVREGRRVVEIVKISTYRGMPYCIDCQKFTKMQHQHCPMYSVKLI